MSPKKRKLLELYQLGKPLTVTQGKESETVWLQKLSQVEADSAFRRAQAAKSRVLSCRQDPDGEDYQSAWMEVLGLGEDPTSLIEFVIAPERAQLDVTTEARLAAEEEWSTDDYLQGLRDAWEDGIKEVHAKDPEDPEAARVFKELRRFSAEVEQAVDAEVEAERRDYQYLSLGDLRNKAMDSILDYRSNVAWLNEYNRAEVWLGTRDADNHDELYFESRAEVDKLATPVIRQLIGAFEELRVDMTEGKDSEETPASSPPSEQPAAGETAPSSGLVAVAR